MMNMNQQNSPMQGATPSPGIDPSQTEPQPLPGQMGTHEEQPMQETQQDSLRKLLESTNIAEKLDEQKLDEIGEQVRKGFELDLASRQDWEDALEDWTKLAQQHRETKSYPWPRASNVKYPLLTTAAMQFAARSYPSLVPSDGKIVKSKVIGKDPTGEKFKLADRVSTYMSYQIMNEMTEWEEGMDKLLIMLPVLGTVFKKTYWDSIEKKPKSIIIHPKNLVVDYWAKSLVSAERISQIIEMSPRILKERQLAKVFLDIDLGNVTLPPTDKNTPSEVDDTTPYSFIEQHTYLDLDDDDYKEPYIVTIHRETGKVLRIQARYSENTMSFDDDNKLVRIEPIQYYTKYGFIPNPDGSFYDIGFGVLLGPINEAVNTVINQLIDSGTTNNLQSGFLGKGLKIRMGEQAFQPGEWKAVNVTGDDLRKQIVPLPSKEPSNVLFQLMGSMITSGKELASVAEIFVGKMPGQNTPATTTMATIEQGMKVFTAVYKRIYRSLEEEFKKLFSINSVYLNPETYAEVVNITVGPDDFDERKYRICPGADPTAVSQTERLLKAQGLMEMLPIGILDPVKVGLRLLEAQEQPNYQDLLLPSVAQSGQLPPPPPNPKVLESQAKVQAMGQASQIKQQEAVFNSQMAQRDQQFQQAMAAQKADQDARHKEVLAAVDLAIKTHTANMQVAADKQQFVQDTVHREVEHRQQLGHKEQMARVQQKAASSKGKVKPK